MAEQKTKPTNTNVLEFLKNFVENEQKFQDSLALLQIMQKVSGHAPQMWGPSIIGFGSYHYKYASGHEGDAPLIGFSPRKAAISLYVYAGYLGDEKQVEMLSNLGKYKMGKACIYVKKLTDINLDVLQQMMQSTISFLKTEYPD